jgi:hypothetical protein
MGMLGWPSMSGASVATAATSAGVASGAWRSTMITTAAKYEGCCVRDATPSWDRVAMMWSYCV